MPSLKSITITIFISILIGGAVFFAVQQVVDPRTRGRGATPLSGALNSLSSSPTPIPTSTPTPINETTNLEGEIDQLKPPDHSDLYQNLQTEVDNF